MSKKPDDLIRIEDAIKVLCRKTRHPGVLCPDSYCAEMWNEFKDVERVDAVPVVHGRWIRHDYADIVDGYYVPNYECSVCHTWKQDDSDYCPDCGAIMDRKDGEQP